MSDARPALRLRQDRRGRAGRRAARARLAAGVERRHGQGDRRRRAAGHRRRRAHRLPGHPRPPGRHAAPEGARRAPGRPRRAGHLADLAELRHRADRPRRRQPLPVRDAARHRADRRRRPGHGPGRGQEPRPRRRRGRPGASTGRCSTSCGAAGALSAATRRRLARTAFAPPRPTTPRSSPGSTRTRRAAGEPSADAARRRCTCALERVQDLRYGENPHQQAARYRVAGARSWWDDAVQHGGKELSYLNLYDTEAAWRLVHRFERAGRASSSSTPTRAASRSPTTSPTPTSRPTPATRSRPSAASWPSTGRCPRRWPRRWPRCSPRSSWRRRSTTTPWPCSAAKKNLRVLSAPPPSATPLDLRTIDGGLLVQDADPVVARPRGVDGGRPWRSPTRPVGRPGASPGRSCAAVSRTPSCSARTARPSASAPASRTGSTRPASPPSKAAGPGRRRGAAPATPSSRSATASTRSPRPASRAVIQPGGSVRDAEVIAAADEHGIAMVFTGERHFRH